MNVSSKVSFSHPWNLSFFRFTLTWVRSSSILIGDCLAPLQAEYFLPQFFWFKVPRNQNMWGKYILIQTGIHTFFIVVMLKHSLQSDIRLLALFWTLSVATFTTHSYLQQLSHTQSTLDIHTYILMNLQGKHKTTKPS